MDPARRRAVLALTEKYQHDWALWGRKVVGLPKAQPEYEFDGFTVDQNNVIQSVQKNKRTLVQSGHSAGKTRIAAFIANAFLSIYPNSQVICTSSSQFQVIKRLWAQFTTIAEKSRTPLYPKHALTATGCKINSEWFATATATNKSDNIQGAHPEHLLCIIDEAQGVDQGIWDAFEGMMGSSHARTLALFNPLSSSGAAYVNSQKPHEWTLVKMSPLNHPNVKFNRIVVPGAVERKWVEDRKKEWGEDHPLYQSRVIGEFPTLSEDTLVSISDLDNAIAHYDGSLSDGIWMGVDIARFGSDSNWCVIVLNGKVIYEEQWSGLDLMVTCGKIHEIVHNFDVPWEHVNIDGTGIGAGVVDRLRELDHDVGDIQFGSAPKNDWAGMNFGIDEMDFLNRRAELYWIARTLLKAKKVCIPKKFSRIWQDLLAPKYEFKSDGALKIESKDDIRARIKKSPDASDAFVLALARDANACPSISFV